MHRSRGSRDGRCATSSTTGRCATSSTTGSLRDLLDHRPTPLEAWRVADAVEAAASAATGQEPPEGQLSSYDTVWSAGGTAARRWVEVEGSYPEEFRDDRPDVPTTWRVRVDAATGGVLALEVEGEDVRTASRG